MQHAAVVGALMPAHARLLFEQGDARVRQPARKLERGAHAHEAAADDEEVFASHDGGECEGAATVASLRAGQLLNSAA